jgi:DNA-binding MarR family transcriptional regulator
MITLAEFECKKSYSYQHLQGEMLLSLNKIAAELKLTHTEYRVMSTLIGYWNKDTGRAYPNIRQLSKVCFMSQTTILRAIKKLTSLSLIFVVKHQSGRQNYFINQKIFLPESNIDVTPPITKYVTQMSNTMKTDKDKTQYKKRDFSKNKQQKPQAIIRIVTEKTDKALEHIKEVSKINEPRLQRKEIIQNLRKAGKDDEANILVNLWNIE